MGPGALRGTLLPRGLAGAADPLPGTKEMPGQAGGNPATGNYESFEFGHIKPVVDSQCPLNR
jgi:hypothetical protein